MNPAKLFSNEPNPLHLASGEVLFTVGDPGDTMFVVLEGALEITVNGSIVEKPVSGDIIGEMALIDKSPRSGTVTARTASILAKLDTVRFERLIQLNPFFATHVMKVLVDRIRRGDHARHQKMIGS